MWQWPTYNASRACLSSTPACTADRGGLISPSPYDGTRMFLEKSRDPRYHARARGKRRGQINRERKGERERARERRKEKERKNATPRLGRRADDRARVPIHVTPRSTRVWTCDLNAAANRPARSPGVAPARRYRRAWRSRDRGAYANRSWARAACSARRILALQPAFGARRRGHVRSDDPLLAAVLRHFVRKRAIFLFIKRKNVRGASSPLPVRLSVSDTTHVVAGALWRRRRPCESAHVWRDYSPRGAGGGGEHLAPAGVSAASAEFTVARGREKYSRILITRLIQSGVAW